MTQLYSVKWKTGVGGGSAIGMPLAKAVEFAEQKAKEGYHDISVKPSLGSVGAAASCLLTVGGAGGRLATIPIQLSVAVPGSGKATPRTLPSTPSLSQEI